MFEEDLHIFVKDFGVKIIFALKNNEILEYYDGNKPIMGIFDNSFFNPELGSIVIQTTNPLLTCVASDVEGIIKGDIVNINGINYKIFNIQPDGTGMTVLDLEKQ